QGTGRRGAEAAVAGLALIAGVPPPRPLPRKRGRGLAGPVPACPATHAPPAGGDGLAEASSLPRLRGRGRGGGERPQYTCRPRRVGVHPWPAPSSSPAPPPGSAPPPSGASSPTAGGWSPPAAAPAACRRCATNPAATACTWPCST